MPFPRRLLVPGEELVLDLRPHPVALALPVLAAVAMIVVGLWILSAIDGFVNWIVWIAIAIVLVYYPVRKIIGWLTSHFVVTSDRVIHREGWIAKRSMEIPLEQINDIRFQQGIFERMVGAGDLLIRSASDSGPNTFKDIRKPEDVQKTIYHQAELNNQRMYSGRGTAGTADDTHGGAPSVRTPNASGAPSSSTELERLADLRDRGVLTQAEFEAQKAKILGGGGDSGNDESVPPRPA